ncbi:MAG: hypothetical protein HY319_02750 [Armatimonadetes bacterium]|nr:hypothetical protein [Armatimonadota bacterium]
MISDVDHRCPDCNQINPVGIPACEGCGRVFPVERPPEASMRISDRGWWMIVAAFMMGAGGMVALRRAGVGNFSQWVPLFTLLIAVLIVTPMAMPSGRRHGRHLGCLLSLALVGGLVLSSLMFYGQLPNLQAVPMRLYEPGRALETDGLRPGLTSSELEEIAGPRREFVFSSGHGRKFHTRYPDELLSRGRALVAQNPSLVSPEFLRLRWELKAITVHFVRGRAAILRVTEVKQNGHLLARLGDPMSQVLDTFGSRRMLKHANGEIRLLGKEILTDIQIWPPRQARNKRRSIHHDPEAWARWRPVL